MPKRVSVAAAILAVLILSVGAASAPQERPQPLEPLRSLAGEWNVIDGQSRPTGLRARYENLAGGSAVLARVLVGTPEETVTLFHADGGLVTATHVSARSAPSRLVPATGAPAGVLAFANLAEDSDAGVSETRMTQLENDGLRVEWSVRDGEGGVETIRHEMRRETELADLAAEVARTRVSLETLQKELDRRLKTAVTVEQDGQPRQRPLETRTFPTEAGWNVSGVPFRLHMHGQTMRFASTFAAEGDAGLTLAHHPFEAGKSARLRFSVMGGHGYVALVEEKRAPPRRIADIKELSDQLLSGEFGDVVETAQGHRATRPLLVEWDLSRFEGRSMRLYVVDAASDHYGQIAVSEISVVEDATD
jgi:hypothetical protein